MCPKVSIPIKGGDFNSSKGNDEDDNGIIGAFENSRRNSKGNTLGFSKG